MKLIIEKEEWQMLGQLALEIRELHPHDVTIYDVLLYEFSVEHAQAFLKPERKSRKLKVSMAIALSNCLRRQHFRNDHFWDLVLVQFRGKVDKLFSSPNPPISALQG